MNMKIYIPLLLTFFVCGCVQNNEKPDILERGFGSSIENAGITFLDGPWFYPGSRYGYHIDDSELKIAHTTEAGGVEIHTYRLQSCSPVREGIKKLREAVQKSIELGLSEGDPRLPEVIVMDGPHYLLSIDSDLMWGSITLEGNGTTSYVVPWVNAAFKIGELAELCEDSANKASNIDLASLGLFWRRYTSLRL